MWGCALMYLTKFCRVCRICQCSQFCQFWPLHACIPWNGLASALTCQPCTFQWIQIIEPPRAYKHRSGVSLSFSQSTSDQGILCLHSSPYLPLHNKSHNGARRSSLYRLTATKGFTLRHCAPYRGFKVQIPALLRHLPSYKSSFSTSTSTSISTSSTPASQTPNTCSNHQTQVKHNLKTNKPKQPPQECNC